MPILLRLGEQINSFLVCQDTVVRDRCIHRLPVIQVEVAERTALPKSNPNLFLAPAFEVGANYLITNELIFNCKIRFYKMDFLGRLFAGIKNYSYLCSPFR